MRSIFDSAQGGQIPCHATGFDSQLIYWGQFFSFPGCFIMSYENGDLWGSLFGYALKRNVIFQLVYLTASRLK